MQSGASRLSGGGHGFDRLLAAIQCIGSSLVLVSWAIFFNSQTESMSNRIIAIGLMSGFGVLGCAETLAQAPPAVQVDSSGWTVRCASNASTLDCKAGQEVRLKNTRQLLVSTVVNIARDTKQPTMLIHLAHGLFLPAGATVQFGKQAPQRLEIQTCDAAGCYAGMAISKDTLTALQSEQEMTVSFQDLQKRPITVRMPLAGFGSAYQKIQ